MDISIQSQLGVPNETEVEKKALFFVNEKQKKPK